MSWYKTVAVSVAVMGLAACGFHPLYGTRAGGAAQDELAQIRIAPIPDRIGQELHNHLLTALNPGGRPERPRYVLTTGITEGARAVAIRKTAFATRTNLRVQATYSVSDIATGKRLFNGESSITVSYNILDSEYATLAVEKDARTRAIRELAEDIRIRLGIFFSDQAAQGK